MGDAVAEIAAIGNQMHLRHRVVYLLAAENSIGPLVSRLTGA